MHLLIKPFLKTNKSWSTFFDYTDPCHDGPNSQTSRSEPFQQQFSFTKVGFEKSILLKPFLQSLRSTQALTINRKAPGPISTSWSYTDLTTRLAPMTAPRPRLPHVPTCLLRTCCSFTPPFLQAIPNAWSLINLPSHQQRSCAQGAPKLREAGE